MERNLNELDSAKKEYLNYFVISGYLSVIASLEANKREVKTVFLDAQRKERAFSSKFKQAEKYQYNKLLSFAKKRGVKVELCAPKTFSELCGDKNSGGIAASVGPRFFEPLPKLLDSGRFFVYVEGIEDPFNYGQLLRTFYACGVDGVITSGRNFYGSDGIILRSSAGASERIRIADCADTELLCTELKNRNIPIYVTGQTSDSVGLYDMRYSLPLCVCIGGERRGLTKKMMENADATIEIKYSKKTDISLSASSAAAIIVHHISSGVNFDN